jgi:alkylated DNA repair dioxygenase AlkB
MPGSRTHSPTFSLPGHLEGNRLAGCRDVAYLPDFLGRANADAAFDRVAGAASWRQERLRLFGKDVLAPRLTDWAGDAGVDYRYSGADHACTGWRPELDALRARIEAEIDWRFNFVLVNRYRDGRDAMGWHADDEAALGARPVIASLSLGATRRFRLRRIATGVGRELLLEHGSLLVMFGESQHAWRHAVPRAHAGVGATGERINLTFRRLVGVRA